MELQRSRERRRGTVNVVWQQIETTGELTKNQRFDLFKFVVQNYGLPAKFFRKRVRVYIFKNVTRRPGSRYFGKLLWPGSAPQTRFRLSKAGIWFSEICGALAGHNNFPEYLDPGRRVTFLKI